MQGGPAACAASPALLHEWAHTGPHTHESPPSRTLVSERDILVPVSFHASEAFTPSWRTDCLTACEVVSSVIARNGREPTPPAGRSPAGTAWGPPRQANRANGQIKCRTQCIVVLPTRRGWLQPGSRLGNPARFSGAEIGLMGPCPAPQRVTGPGQHPATFFWKGRRLMHSRECLEPPVPEMPRR